MKAKIMDKYILKETISPFLIGIIIITIIMLSNFLFELTDWLIIDNIPLSDILFLLVYRLPELIVNAVPIAVLFGVVNGLGRLNNENEFLAFRMGGVSIHRILIPLLVLGIVISSFIFIFNELVVPKSNRNSFQIVRKHSLSSALPEVKENIFFTDQQDRIFYVSNYNPEEQVANNIMIYNSNTKGENFPPVITAVKAEIENKKWNLTNGTIHKYDDSGRMDLETHFNNLNIDFEMDTENLLVEQKSISEMTRSELKKEIELFKRSGMEVNSLLVEYHSKLSSIFTPIIFILVAVPLVLGRKNNKTINIIMMVALIFSYYLLFSLSKSFGSNDLIPPLLSAFLPHLLFLGLSFLLFRFREKWQIKFYGFIKKYFSVFALITFILLISPQISAYEIHLNADSINFNGENKTANIEGNVFTRYDNVFIRTDEMEVIGEDEDILNDIKKIDFPTNEITGCNHEKPHYYFKASKTVVKPDKYLIAYNVVLWELQGKLPIFYTPVLYISLDDDRNFFFDFGYSSTRGYFLKTTYQYLINNLPGEVYLDKYTQSGYAGGIKQYLINNSNHEFFIKYLTQQNNDNLSSLYNNYWELDYKQDYKNTNNRFNAKYYDYDKYYRSKGQADIKVNNDSQNINFQLNFEDKNFYDSIINDDRDYNFDLNYSYNLTDRLAYNLNLDGDYLIEKGDREDQERLSADTDITYNGDRLKAKLLYKRYAPNFREKSEDDNVDFLKKPELQMQYKLFSFLNYNLTAGEYSESGGEVKGKRIKNELELDKSLRLNKYLRVRTNQKINRTDYDTETTFMDNSFNDYFDEQEVTVEDRGQYYSYEPEYIVTFTPTDRITFENNYKLVYREGYTPFEFDFKDYKERLDSRLSYNYNAFSFDLTSEYDFYVGNLETADLGINYNGEKYTARISTGYDFGFEEFYDLNIKNSYEGKYLTLNSELEYNLNDMQITESETGLEFDFKDEWYISLQADYDHLNSEFDRAELAINKNFHCREIRFSYDHIDEEYKIVYQINLFESGFGLTRDREGNTSISPGIDEDIEI